MMTLQEQFKQDLQAQGMTKRTQSTYLRAVRQLTEHYNLSPDKISDEQIRQHIISLQKQTQFSEGTVMQLFCGLKLFYRQILDRPLKVNIKAPACCSGKTYFPPELRQRFIEDLPLQGLSARTQDAYTRTVRQLAERMFRTHRLKSLKKTCAGIFSLSKTSSIGPEPP